MRGAAYDRFGDLDVLTVRDDLPEPPVGPDTVLVRTHAAGVNPVDLTIRAGGLAGAFPHHFPIIPGWEVAGVVEAAGPAVHGLAPGDEVFGYVRRDDVQWGTTAELVPAPQRCVARAPSSLSLTEGAAVPLAGLTAYLALTEALEVGEGDRVLVHRAAGGVGFFAVQIAVALGAHVIGTASPRNHAFLRDAGCAEVVDHAAGPVSGQLAEPVDAVLDLVGNATLRDSLACVRPKGRVCLAGFLGGLDPVPDFNPLADLPSGVELSTFASAFVLGDDDFPLTDVPLQDIVARAERGTYRAKPVAVFDFDAIAEAHRALETNATPGKLVVRV